MNKCPFCESPVYLKKHDGILVIVLREITYTCESYYCEDCVEYYNTRETLDKNLAAARSVLDD